MAAAEETQAQTAELAAVDLVEILVKMDLLELLIREAAEEAEAKLQVRDVQKAAAEAALESLS